MDNETPKLQNEEISKEQKGLLVWIKKHRNELVIAGLSVSTLIFVALGVKNRDEIIAFWNNLKTEIAKQNKYSSKWFETVTDEILDTEREKIRLDYCASGANFDEACRLERLLRRFDKEISKRSWGGEITRPPAIHREHGWYLPNDD